MKKLRLLLLGAALFTTAIIQAQTADEIIDKHLEAMGGKEKLKQLSTMTTEGSLNANGMEIPVKITQAHNKGQRVDITAMGVTGYIIQTPTAGWVFMPFQGHTKAESTPAETVKETADALDLQNSLLDYKQKGHTVEYLGKDDVDGTSCHKLKLILKGGLEQTHFIDPANYYIIKTINKSKASGQVVEQTQTFSNFKKLDEGYVFPFTMTGFGPGEITFTKIEVNKPIDESIFKPSN